MKDTFQMAYKIGILVVLAVLFSACGDKPTNGPKTDKEIVKTGPAEGDLPDGLTPETAAKVVAKVGDQTITVGDVTRQINRLSPYIRRRWAAPEKRKEFLDKLVRVELLSQEAARLGLTEDPEVQRTTKQVMIRLMVKNDLEKELFPTKIDEDILESKYQEERDKYERPPQVRASHILVQTKPEAEKLLAEIKANPDDNQLFRNTARKMSLDSQTKARGGDIGYFSDGEERRDDEPEVDPAIVKAVWTLENAGDVYPDVVETEKGFHVVKLTNKRAEMSRSFESVKRMIENKVLREERAKIMEKFIDDLKKAAKIEIFKENLAKADFSVDEKELTPPASTRPGARPEPPKPELPKPEPPKPEAPKPEAPAAQ